MARAYDLLKGKAAQSQSDLLSNLKSLLDTEQQKANESINAMIGASFAASLTLWYHDLAGSGGRGHPDYLYQPEDSHSDPGLVAPGPAIAAGDLSGESLTSTGADELSELTVAVNDMQSKLAEMIRAVATSAEQLAAATDRTRRRHADRRGRQHAD